ncbi:MAG: citrate synthase, partial [Verrucomicrobia bacterium]|nr:citrate synthase [Verrucomicrobiota bacterium]
MPVTAKGLEGIVANSTRLSDVRGDVGQLIYAGYDINELAGKVTFCEVLFLLYQNRLPKVQELQEFEAKLRSYRQLPAQVVDFLKSAPKDAVPMDVIRTAVSMLGLYAGGTAEEDPANRDQILHRCLDITAKIGVIAAYYHRARQGKDLPPVREDLTEAQHFLYLLNGEVPTKEAADVLDMALVLHADHGMNASTFSARVTVA